MYVFDSTRTIICLVEFKGVALDAMPRIYLARPVEIVARLKAASGGRGDTILYENYTRGPRAAGAGNVERIPDGWRLTSERINALMKEAAN
jgi:hypothetical protein